LTGPDLPSGSAGVGGVGSDAADPVAAARAWLLQNGGVVPDDLDQPDPAAPRAGASRRRGGRRASAGAGDDESLAAEDLTGLAGAGPGGAGAEPDAEADGSRPARRSGRGDRGGRGGSRRAGSSPDAAADLEADPESVARTIVLRKLSAQARTRHELSKALAARDVPEEVARTVLDRMEEVGLVDDATFAHDWVESRQQRRHLSRSALRRELQTKGVDRELVEEAVSEVDGGDELQAARELAERKFRSMADLPREVQYRRLAGALARRGFGPGVSAPVLSEVLDARRTD